MQSDVLDITCSDMHVVNVMYMFGVWVGEIIRLCRHGDTCTTKQHGGIDTVYSVGA